MLTRLMAPLQKSVLTSLFLVPLGFIMAGPALPSLAAVSPPSPQEAVEQLTPAGQTFLSPKTLERKFDCIVFTGDNLVFLLGKKISHLRLYAHVNGKFRPIAFQIDERGPDGEFIYTAGKTAGEDVDKGKFDENDELLFISGHAGNRVAGNLWPKGHDAGHEIVITDPQDPEKKSWAYIFSFPNAPPARSDEDYVDYDAENDRIIGKYYTVGYEKGYALFTDLIYPEESGGNGEDLLDRIKVRMDIQLLGGLVHIKRKESDVRSKIIGWKDGPIRVLRNVEMYFRVIFNIPSPSLFSVTEYYPHYFYVPMRFTVPFNLKYVMNAFVVKGFMGQFYGDFSRQLLGARGITYSNPEGILFSGHTTEEELRRKYDLNKIDGGCFSKEGVGAWCVRMAMPDMFLQYINIHIKDDLDYHNPPEDDPGELAGGALIYSESIKDEFGCPGCKGFSPDSWNTVQKGSFELCLDTFIAPPQTTLEEMKKDWWAIKDYPLDVAVSELGKETGLVLGEKDPKLIKAVIFDRKGRQISLRDIAFHVGSARTTGWDYVIGYHFDEDKWYTIPFSEIRQIDFRIEDYEPTTGLYRPLFINVTKKDGTRIDLFHCKPASFEGHTAEDKTFLMWNPMIERIELRD